MSNWFSTNEMKHLVAWFYTVNLSLLALKMPGKFKAKNICPNFSNKNRVKKQEMLIKFLCLE